jgi:F0F1-type ATP synthase membrane subunit a
VSNFWNGKRRWVALGALLAGFVVMLRTPPVIPVIQLPGEKYPEGYDFLGLRVTNTFVGSVVVWILLLLLIYYINRRRPKSSAEVPPGGFYNLFETLFEGLYNFVGNIAGGTYFPLIFKIFMTIFLVVLLSNWTELIPTIDSVGFIEPHTEVVLNETTGEYVREPVDGYEIYKTFIGGWAVNGQCSWISPEAEQAEDETVLVNARAAANEILADAADAAALERLAAAEAHGEETEAVEASESDPETEAKAAYDQTLADRDAKKEGRANKECYSGVRAVIWPDYTDSNGTIAYAQTEEAAPEEHAETVTTEAASETHEVETTEAGETAVVHVETGVPAHPEPGSEDAKAVPWVVLPFWRAPSTDLNVTLSLALIAFVMIQVVGFKALGPGYLKKFFNFGTLLKSPLGAIDMAVGLLEFIGELAKILSFSFRLLGNIFAGSILLFVMSFLVPFLPWPFFILEFGVGIIQAVVFGLLTAIFMNLATLSHHDEEHGEEPAH